MKIRMKDASAAACRAPQLLVAFHPLDFSRTLTARPTLQVCDYKSTPCGSDLSPQSLLEHLQRSCHIVKSSNHVAFEEGFSCQAERWGRLFQPRPTPHILRPLCTRALLTQCHKITQPRHIKLNKVLSNSH